MELWRFFVSIKSLLPLGVVQRRQRAGDDIPLRDRKPRAGKPGDAAEDNLYEQHDDAGIDPDRYRSGGNAGRRSLHSAAKFYIFIQMRSRIRKAYYF